MLAPTHPFTADEWDRINTWLDAIYRDFIEKVASGRRMPVDRVHEIARGRVWTGADAGRQRARRRARRAARRGRDRPPPGGPARRRAAARLPQADPARPVPPAGVQRLPPRGRRGAQRRLRRRLGLAWRLAAHLGLPPYGPLIVPGTLDNPLTERPVARLAGTDVAAAWASWAGAVTLVTVADGRDDVGVTVSSFCPVSADPPLVLVSLMSGSYPAELFGPAPDRSPGSR